MKRNSFNSVASFICKQYGNSVVGRLLTDSGNVIPRCYVHYSSNRIFTTDINKKNKYEYIEL